MTENTRKRMSKWDVISDPQILHPKVTESGVELGEDDQFQETNLKSDWNSLGRDGEQFCPHADDKDDISMGNQMSEADGLYTGSSLTESIRPSNDTLNQAHFAKQSDFGSEKTFHQSVSKRSKRYERNADADFQADGTFDRDFDDWRRHGCDFSPRGGLGSSQRRSRSRSRSRSRTRNRNRSRSRSPLSMKPGSDAWPYRGRIRTEQPPPCRDFAAGRCRRGSQCKFLHDEQHRMSDRPYDENRRERAFERERNSGHDSKEKIGGSRNQSDYIQDKPYERYGKCYDDGNRDDPGMYRNNKSSELCHNFRKGRCQRGSSCRYLHHEPSLHGEQSVEANARVRTQTRRDQDSSCGEKFESRRVKSTPCKYFAEGRCTRGLNCRFSHHEVPDGLNDVYRDNDDGRNVSNWDSRTFAIDTRNSSSWNSGVDDVNAVASQLIKEENSIQDPQHNQSEINEKNRQEDVQQEVSKNYLSSQEASLQHLPALSLEILADNAHRVQQESDNHKNSVLKSGAAIDNNLRSLADISSVNNVVSVPPVHAQGLAKSEQGQFLVSQMQSNVPSVQIPHMVTPLPLNSQIRQDAYPIPPTGQGQPMISVNPSNSHDFNLPMQNSSIPYPIHIGQTQQKSNSEVQLQQNAAFIDKGQSQQDLSLNNYNSQFGAPPMHGQTQQNLNKSLQIPHQGVIPFQVGQGQQTILTLSSEAQGHGFVSETSSNRQTLKPDSHQISSHTVSADTLKEIVDASEANLSPLKSDTIISGKIVTSEQAEKITNLSASLAQFFGNATLNTTGGGIPNHSVLNTNPMVLVPAIAPSSQGFGNPQIHDSVLSSLLTVRSEPTSLPTGLQSNSEMKRETSSYSSFQMPVTEHDKPAANEAQPSLGVLPTQTNEAEGKSNYEVKANLDDVEANDQANDESKQAKDVKAMKVFKCALVEFVKDILKPVWKEGQLSKEAHKTIVKKVVDKVTTAMQGPNLPRTQEKVDHYLVHSKPKLSKLVQAYVEKYAKN